MNRQAPRARDEFLSQVRELWFGPIYWPCIAFFSFSSVYKDWHWSLQVLMSSAWLLVFFVSTILMIPVQAVVFAIVLIAAVVMAPIAAVRAVSRRLGERP